MSRRDPDVDEPFDEEGLPPDPIALFRAWRDEVSVLDLPEPDAVVLATASPDGAPSARVVLLRGVDQDGFRFFTNYESRKGTELASNPRASMVFHWQELRRQVRVEGDVERLATEESAAYFSRRPRGSRISAWASPQSRVVDDRRALEARVAELERRYPDDVPLPPFWGGYLLRPRVVEFWQHRASRLHDRLVYRRDGGHGWNVVRLGP